MRKYVLLNIETTFGTSVGLDIKVGEDDPNGIVGYLPVFKNKKSAEKFAKRKDNAGEIIAVEEKEGGDERDKVSGLSHKMEENVNGFNFSAP
jgi:hypothetical protein